MAKGADIHVLYDAEDKADAAHPIRQGDRHARPGYCDHKRVSVEKEARKVTCRACGREIDAFDFLYSLAGAVEMYVDLRKDAHRRATRARERLADLERRIRNAKSRLRRAER